MTSQQSATLAAVQAGRVAAWLIVYPDGSIGCILDRARAETVAVDRHAVLVELGSIQGQNRPNSVAVSQVLDSK